MTDVLEVLRRQALSELGTQQRLHLGFRYARATASCKG